MKFIFITFISLFLIFGCSPNIRTNYYIKTVPTPEKHIVSLAIIPENYDNYWVSSFAYRALITELMDVGFTVIERSNLESIIGEQKIQLSGVIKDEESESQTTELRILDKNSIAKLGEIFGVGHLLMVYVVPSGREIHMATLRLVDVTTAEILTSTTLVTPRSGQEVDLMMKQVAIDIAEVINTKKRIIRNKLFTTPNSSPAPSGPLGKSPNELRKNADKKINKSESLKKK